MARNDLVRTPLGEGIFQGYYAMLENAQPIEDYALVRIQITDENKHHV